MEKLGVSTQLLAPGDIFQALQLGTIDATEFSMPALTRSRLYQVAKFYYFPAGTSRPRSSTFHQQEEGTRSDQQRAIIELACGDTLSRHPRRGRGDPVEGDEGNARQERRQDHALVAGNAKAYEKAWLEVAAEESAKSPNFKKTWDSYRSSGRLFPLARVRLPEPVIR
jgi:TRAP-type mannitol/chloroaromatic compound transport system substrate-binding protein